MHRVARTAYLLSALLLFSSCASSSESTSSDNAAASRDPFVDWRVRNGDKQARRFSKLDQINRANVQHLERAWVHHTGDVRDDGRGTIEATPIIVDGVLYVTSPALKVVAVDAATGEEKWTFDPYKGDQEAKGVNRGVAYWESEDGADKRILFTAGWTPRLFALDAETGEPIESFGDDGVVDFTKGISKEGFTSISATSPGMVYEDLLILGTRIVKTPDRPSGRGDVAAYNVRTGEREWIFHTIPKPGEFGNDTWEGDSWRTEGGANSWNGMSLDRKRGWVFLPVTSPGYSFYGGTRKGDNLFTGSVVALNADTGERIWHYQMIHHDVWDRDLGAAPVLMSIEHDGEQVDALAQASKRGDLFVLNRETGEPIFPVKEEPQDPSDLPGEKLSPTQPVPTKPKPFSRQGYDRSDLPTRSEEARQYALKRFNKMHSGDRFIPPNKEGTIMLPGLRGGAHWGGAAFDPETDMLYINDTNVPWIMKMLRAEMERSPETSGNVTRALDRKLTTPPTEEEAADQHTQSSAYPYVMAGYNKFVAPDGYPAIKPPWGTLNAIDLDTGEKVWDVPLGNYEELSGPGEPDTGTDNLGGPIVTAGGLVFIGATKDEKFRAFDSETGEVVWETDLPAGGYATPATYEIDGRQYVVIACGGEGLLNTPKGDAIVAFALPQ